MSDETITNTITTDDTIVEPIETTTSETTVETTPIGNIIEMDSTEGIVPSSEPPPLPPSLIGTESPLNI